jgi:plasmid stabilization system protein ParE
MLNAGAAPDSRLNNGHPADGASAGAPGLRNFPVGEYMILYRIEAEDVLILRVLRGSRDLPAFFG